MPIALAARPSRPGLLGSLRRIVKAALEQESCRAGEITIVLADDAFLRALNHRYRGIDRATDVLSFDYAEAGARPRGGVVHGDLIVSLDRVRAQAVRYRVTQGHELARLVVHGALHLSGLDHGRARERTHMRSREKQVMGNVRAAIASLDAALGTGARRHR